MVSHTSCYAITHVCYIFALQKKIARPFLKASNYKSPLLSYRHDFSLLCLIVYNILSGNEVVSTKQSIKYVHRLCLNEIITT